MGIAYKTKRQLLVHIVHSLWNADGFGANPAVIFREPPKQYCGTCLAILRKYNGYVWLFFGKRYSKPVEMRRQCDGNPIGMRTCAFVFYCMFVLALLDALLLQLFLACSHERCQLFHVTCSLPLLIRMGYRSRHRCHGLTRCVASRARLFRAVIYSLACRRT